MLLACNWWVEIVKWYYCNSFFFLKTHTSFSFWEQRCRVKTMHMPNLHLSRILWKSARLQDTDADSYPESINWIYSTQSKLILQLEEHRQVPFQYLFLRSSSLAKQLKDNPIQPCGNASILRKSKPRNYFPDSTHYTCVQGKNTGCIYKNHQEIRKVYTLWCMLHCKEGAIVHWVR